MAAETTTQTTQLESRWIAHTTADGASCAKCTTCGANSHPANVGTDEDCARCVTDSLRLPPLQLARIDVSRWIRI